MITKYLRRSIIWKIPLEELKLIVSKAKTYTEVQKILGLNCRSGTNKTLKQRIQEDNINISHFISNVEFIKNHAKTIQAIPLDKMLVKGDLKGSRHNLRRKILDAGLLNEKCCICGLNPFWQNKPLTLQLHHISGDPLDNRLENLSFICPNCHSQLETSYGRKNKKNPKVCATCGKNICRKSKMYCRDCNSHMPRYGLRKYERPSKDELEGLIKNHSYTEIGKPYGVRGATIKRWLKDYGIILPNRKGFWSKGYKHTEETKEKMRKNHKSKNIINESVT